MATSDDWRTPPELFEALNREFGFVLDVAASAENALCNDFFTEGRSALDHDWHHPRKASAPIPFAWCNPPYSDPGAFLGKAVEELAKGIGSVFLIPAAVEAVYWERFVWPVAAEVRLVRRRIAFISPETGRPVAGNRYNSAIVVFRPFWPGSSPHVFTIDQYWRADPCQPSPETSSSTPTGRSSRGARAGTPSSSRTTSKSSTSSRSSKGRKGSK